MTQENKHTPAPWVTGQVSWDEETKDVRYTLHGVKEAKVADCNLIAAAPDLLEALELMVLKLGTDEIGNDLNHHAVKRANKAIAKARGQS